MKLILSICYFSGSIPWPPLPQSICTGFAVSGTSHPVANPYPFSAFCPISIHLSASLWISSLLPFITTSTGSIFPAIGIWFPSSSTARPRSMMLSRLSSFNLCFWQLSAPCRCSISCVPWPAADLSCQRLPWSCMLISSPLRVAKNSLRKTFTV